MEPWSTWTPTPVANPLPAWLASTPGAFDGSAVPSIRYATLTPASQLSGMEKTVAPAVEPTALRLCMLVLRRLTTILLFITRHPALCT